MALENPSDGRGLSSSPSDGCGQHHSPSDDVESRGLTQPLVLRLPDKTTIEIEACRDELILDLKQILTEILPTCFYTNFKFHHHGRPISELSDIKSLLSQDVSTDEPAPAPILDIVPDRYGERSLKLHIRRIRELLTNPDVPILHSNVVKPSAFGSGKNDVVVEATPSDEKFKKKNRKKKKKLEGEPNVSINISNVSKQQHSSSDPDYFTAFLAGSSPMFDVKLDFIDRIVKCGTLLNVDEITNFLISPNGIRKSPCLLSIKSSGWNPPTPQWRLRGDLWYLEVTTLESTCLLVIGQENGFFVATETGTAGDLSLNPHWWNPSIRPKRTELGVDRFWTLHELLKSKSPKYCAAVQEITIDASAADPNLSYRITPPPNPVYGWVVNEAGPSVDFSRVENALERATGCDTWDATREWNEELQYSRELPRTDMNLFFNQNQMRQRNRLVRRQQQQEMLGAPFALITEELELVEGQHVADNNTHQHLHNRNGILFEAEDAAIIRERNLHKFSSHLKTASAQGAINIREGKILPLGNSEDQLMPLMDDSLLDGSSSDEMRIADDVKVYAWNNLFLVQASEVPDSDPSQKKRDPEQGNHDKQKTSVSNEMNGDENKSCWSTSFCTRRGMLADIRASELLASIDSVQAVAFGASLRPPESHTSTLSQNEKCRKREDNFEVLLTMDQSRTTNLYCLASSLVDYAGERTLCQTIIPGMLSGELNSRPIFGAASLGEVYICDPSAQQLIERYLQKALGLKYHTFRDCTGTEVRTCVPVECKVLEGADHRRYISDMGRVVPVDLNSFTEEEISLMINAKNSRHIRDDEMKLRQQVARKNSGMLVRLELLAAYLYQAATKLQTNENFDWSKFKLQVDQSFSSKQEEKRAKAAFEWAKSLGLQFCPEFIAHIVPSSFSSKSIDPMTKWPGLEMFLFKEKFHWHRLPDVIKKIAKCVAHKVACSQISSTREEQKVNAIDLDDSQRSLDGDSLDRQFDRWSVILGEGYQALTEYMPLTTSDVTKLHDKINTTARETMLKKSSLCRTDEQLSNTTAEEFKTDDFTAPEFGSKIAQIIESFITSYFCSNRVLIQSKEGIENGETWTSEEPEDVNTPKIDSEAQFQYPDYIKPPLLFNCNISNLCIDLVADNSSRGCDILQLQNLATYLKDVAIPRLVNHLVANIDDCPLDTHSISEVFHAFGVNMRYLGIVLRQIKERFKLRPIDLSDEKELEKDQKMVNKKQDPLLLVEVLERDLLARCIVYELNNVLVHYPMGTLAEVACYLLNIICNAQLQDTVTQPEIINKDFHSLPSKEQFWAAVSSRAIQHFKYSELELPSHYFSVLHHRYPLIRTICRKAGIQLTPSCVVRLMKCVANEADLSTDSTLGSLLKSALTTKGNPQNGFRKKHINGTDLKQKQKVSKYEPLNLEDISGFVPVNKSETPAPRVTHLSFATAVVAHSLDLFEIAFECHQQCIQVIHQMGVPISREVFLSQCCTASLLIHLGDLISASLCIQKIILLIEKLEGPDHPHLIYMHHMLAKVSMSIIAAPETIHPHFSSTNMPLTHQLLIQLHHLNICKNSLEKAITLTKLWTGVTFKSPILPQLLVQSAKVALTSMSFLGMLQHQSNSICLTEFSETTIQAIRTVISSLPSPFTSPVLADAEKILSILYATSEMSAFMKKYNTASIHTIAQLESELTSQYLAAGESRRALDSARRHRDLLIELLGPTHIDVELLDRQISALTRQAVMRAKHERSMLRGVDVLPTLTRGGLMTAAGTGRNL